MSNWQGHIAFGFIISSILIFLLHYFNIYTLSFPWEWLAFLIIVPAYSVLPDIDIKSSKPFAILLLLAIIGAIYFIWVGNKWYAIALLVILGLIAFATKHRGKIHSLLFALIASLPLFMFGSNLTSSLIFIFIGFMAVSSHLFLDRIT